MQLWCRAREERGRAERVDRFLARGLCERRVVAGGDDSVCGLLELAAANGDVRLLIKHDAPDYGNLKPTEVQIRFREAMEEAGEKKAADIAKAGEGTGAITRVNYGEHYTIVEGKKALKPNIEYISPAGCRYVTDSKGRIVSVEGTLQLGKVERNPYAQKVVGREDRHAKDEGGHLIASVFKSSGDIDNLVPMNAKLNKSEYRVLENRWKKALEESKTVEVIIKPVYNGSSMRPSEFEIKFTIDGKPREVSLTNYM